MYVDYGLWSMINIPTQWLIRCVLRVGSRLIAGKCRLLIDGIETLDGSRMPVTAQNQR